MLVGAIAAAAAAVVVVVVVLAVTVLSGATYMNTSKRLSQINL
jgi:hypothetical protein